MTLESLVKMEIAQRWRVTSRTGQWAQVALPDKNYQEVHDEALDRPFQVEGRFSDAELIGIVQFIRSSPRKPPLPDGPDGTSYGEFGEVRGHLPISFIERQPGLVIVTLRSSHTSGDSITLDWANRQWQIREIISWIA